MKQMVQETKPWRNKHWFTNQCVFTQHKSHNQILLKQCHWAPPLSCSLWTTYISLPSPNFFPRNLFHCSWTLQTAAILECLSTAIVLRVSFFKYRGRVSEPGVPGTLWGPSPSLSLSGRVPWPHTDHQTRADEPETSSHTHTHALTHTHTRKNSPHKHTIIHVQMHSHTNSPLHTNESTVRLHWALQHLWFAKT